MDNNLRQILNNLCFPDYWEGSDSYLIKGDNSYLVKYPDAQLVCTEGQEYASWIFSDFFSGNSGSQATFDKLYYGTIQEFPALAGDLRSWKKDGDATATDAELERIKNLTRAQTNVDKGIWKKTNIDYRKCAKKLSDDMFAYSTISFKDKTGYAWHIQSAGIRGADITTSPFIANTEKEVKILYNPSYSLHEAYELLAIHDQRWKQVENNLYKIDRAILANYGRFPDWLVVTINKSTGNISLNDKISSVPEFAYSGKESKSFNEHTRVVLRLAQDYIRNKDPEALALLKQMAKLPAFSMSNFKHAGYTNELTISIVSLLMFITNDQQNIKICTDKLMSDVLPTMDKGYLGNPYYNSRKHGFNQMLTQIALSLLKQYLSEK